MMRRTRRSVGKGRSPHLDFMDEIDDFEPDPVTLELYRIVPQGRRVFLASLAWYERSLADIAAQFGGGDYQIVVRHRGRARVTPVFAIAGPPIEGMM